MRIKLNSLNLNDFRLSKNLPLAHSINGINFYPTNLLGGFKKEHEIITEE